MRTWRKMVPASKPKILVIEDEEGIRRLISAALEPLYVIYLAIDGHDGLSQARWVQPNVILLDLQMPRMDGLTVLAKLKASPHTNGIPVIVVSVQGETEMLLECQRAGAADHLIKPFQIDDLRALIQRQLSMREG